jgi:hypothetical protein
MSDRAARDALAVKRRSEQRRPDLGLSTRSRTTGPSSQFDAHYTPPELATTLVKAVRQLRPTVIADLAAGEGQLLAEAEKVWPDATVLAADIDPAAVRQLARRHDQWVVRRCDIRDGRARDRQLRKYKGRVSLLLLNPPFSCRGGTTYEAGIGARVVPASAALSFLLVASTFLSRTGSIAALMPTGSLHSRKDALGWATLRRRFNIATVETFPRGAFPGTAASVSLVVLRPGTNRPETKKRRTTALGASRQLSVRIVRGCCPMYPARTEPEAPVLVHSTDLKANSVHLNGRRGHGAFRCVEGAAVLVPRVGQITPGKVAFLNATTPVMISDCVIALEADSVRIAKAVQKRLQGNFETLEREYVGTGAPFITLSRLQRALDGLDIVPTIR